MMSQRNQTPQVRTVIVKWNITRQKPGSLDADATIEYLVM